MILQREDRRERERQTDRQRKSERNMHLFSHSLIHSLAALVCALTGLNRRLAHPEGAPTNQVSYRPASAGVFLSHTPNVALLLCSASSRNFLLISTLVFFRLRFLPWNAFCPPFFPSEHFNTPKESHISVKTPEPSVSAEHPLCLGTAYTRLRSDTKDRRQPWSYLSSETAGSLWTGNVSFPSPGSSTQCYLMTAHRRSDASFPPALNFHGNLRSAECLFRRFPSFPTIVSRSHLLYPLPSFPKKEFWGCRNL